MIVYFVASTSFGDYIRVIVEGNCSDVNNQDGIDRVEGAEEMPSNKHADADYVKLVNSMTCPVERLNVLYNTTDSLVTSMARMIVVNSLVIICTK